MDTTNSLISSNEESKVTLATLINAASVEKLFADIKRFWPAKKKLNYAELDILIEGSHTIEEVAHNISCAIVQATEEEALRLWNLCASDLKYAMIIPDRGNVDLDLVKKLEIEGKVICNAFLKHINFAVPKVNPRGIVYGEYSAETAEELAAIIEDLWALNPYGRIIVQEFFRDTDLRILYVLATREIDQATDGDSDNGEHVYLALKSGDQVPANLPLLLCMQQYVPESFNMLAQELTNIVWKENRALFWEGYMRLHNPHCSTNLYMGDEDSEAADGDREKDRFEDNMDNYLKNQENE